MALLELDRVVAGYVDGIDILNGLTLGVARGTVTGIIDRMEREGLVTRERSKEDRRVVYIKLTAKGRELAQGIPVEPMEIFRNALESLSAQEMKDLMRIMTKVAKRVRQIVRRDVSPEEKP